MAETVNEEKNQQEQQEQHIFEGKAADGIFLVTDGLRSKHTKMTKN